MLEGWLIRGRTPTGVRAMESDEQQAFLFRAVFEDPQGEPSEGCLVVLAAEATEAAERGAVETQAMLADPTAEEGALVLVHAWLEPVVSHVITADGEADAHDWLGDDGDEDEPTLYFCTADTLSGRQPFSQGGVVHAHVNAVVRAGDFDEAEAVWRAYLDDNHPGMVVSGLGQGLPPAVGPGVSLR